MEALSSILKGGLGVGILLQGKKIKDDNKTLLQTGILRGNELDSLGFSLEPNSFRTSQSSHPAKCSLIQVPHEAPQSLNRSGKCNNFSDDQYAHFLMIKVLVFNDKGASFLMLCYLHATL